MTHSDKTVFQVQTREVVGKKVRNIRKNGLTPANITGLGEASQSISLTTKSFQKHVELEGESGLLYLQLDGARKEIPVLIDEIQQTPVGSELQHVVFRRVNLKEKVTAEVPVEVVGELDVPGATLVVVVDSLEVEALPTDLPESFVVNVSSLTEVGQQITANELNYDKTTVSLTLSEEELENPIVLVQELKEEKVVEEASETAEEGAEVKVEGELEEKTEPAAE